ncbi:hypothetical protein ACFXHA_26620 [Nocardia sp. NPDC059240]|uniref:hypothetical protein n=1 Tax=Nocardia sp. NPDC059240 TaxID=3346786 RepID=UPI0036C2DE1F
MEIIMTLAWAAVVAIRVLPEIIRSQRTCISVMVTARGEGIRELAIVATNIEDAAQIVRQALAAPPEERRRACRTGIGLLSQRGCESSFFPTDPIPPADSPQ